MCSLFLSHDDTVGQRSDTHQKFWRAIFCIFRRLLLSDFTRKYKQICFTEQINKKSVTK